MTTPSINTPFTTRQKLAAPPSINRKALNGLGPHADCLLASARAAVI